jgi:type III pantothenate kinase
VAFHLYNILLIDIGNSAIKWRYQGEYHSLPVKEFRLNLLPNASKIFVGCVGDKSILKGLNKVVFIKSQATFNVFKSAYAEPQDLGVDRFLAMVASIYQNPNKNLLIIDLGSALTFDLVLANGEHQGGLIMPGLSKLRRSFEVFSSNSKNITLAQIANNTADAWEYGTAQMLMSVIKSQIEYHQSKLGNLQIILTGGDAKMVAYRLNYQASIKPNLVIEGLYLYAQSLN